MSKFMNDEVEQQRTLLFSLKSMTDKQTDLYNFKSSFANKCFIMMLKINPINQFKAVYFVK